MSMCAPTIAGDSCLKARVGNADDLQASVHDLQIHAGNANTFPDVDTTGTCDSLHQGLVLVPKPTQTGYSDVCFGVSGDDLVGWHSSHTCFNMAVS